MPCFQNVTACRNVTEFIGVGVVKTEPKGEETTFLVQEFMNGGTLKKMVTRQMMKAGRLYSNEDALRWVTDVARALQYLHNSKPTVSSESPYCLSCRAPAE